MKAFKMAPYYYRRCALFIMVLAAVVAVAPFATLEALNKGKTAESLLSIAEARAKQKFSVSPGGLGGADPEDFSLSSFALMGSFDWAGSFNQFQTLTQYSLRVSTARSIPLYLLYCTLKLEL